MHFDCSERLGKLKPKYLVVQNKRIKELQQSDKQVINLGRGNPDQPTFPRIVECLQEAIYDKNNHGYPPYGGKQDFKKAIVDFYRKEYGANISSNQVAIMNGSTIALSGLAQALLNPGDIALVPDPGFFGYQAAVELAGGEPFFVPISENNHFLVDYSSIPEEVSQRAKILFLNYPNNPTGANATREFFEETITYANKYGIAVIHDFAYADIYYTEEKPISFLSISGAAEVGVEIYTFSKTFNMAGWRSGFTVGNESLIKHLSAYLQNAVGSVFGGIQDASVFALLHQQAERNALRELYHERQLLVEKCLETLDWEYVAPQGTFFLWAKVPLPMNSVEFAEQLLEEALVAVVPGSIYGKNGEGWIRISLVTSMEQLKESFERIKRFLLGKRGNENENLSKA